MKNLLHPKLARSAGDVALALGESRRLQGLTQQQLAELSCLPQKEISKIENGKSAMKLKTICYLLAALDLELVVQPRTKASPDIWAEIYKDELQRKS